MKRLSQARVLLVILVICGTLLAGSAGGVAVATADVENTTDRVSPSQFDTHEGDILWETDENIRSGGAPTVVDGILVMTTGGIDSPNPVVAYDVGTGEKRWSTDIPADGSPTVVDGTVYVTGTDGVWALDLELGSVEWHVEFNGGASSAQSVGDGSVYVGGQVDAGDDRLWSLDADTGDENWSIETDEIKAGPTFVDGTVYFFTSSGMTAVDADNGDERWQWDAEEFLDLASAPTVADGLVYVSHTAGEDDPGLVSAIDADNGERAWQKELGVAQEGLDTLPTAPTVAAENNEPTVYVGYNGLYALDPADGSERWTDDDAVFDAPTVADGTLFVPQTTDSETFRALDPNDGSELWSVETGDRSEIIVVDGVAYVTVTTGDKRLMAIDAGVTGSSSDSRVMLGGQNHHHEWTGKVPETDPRVVDVDFDEGVFVDDDLTVLATVRNDWDPTTSATYTLELDDDLQGSQTVEVPAYGTNTVELPMTAPGESGEYTLGINGEEIGTLTVVDEDDPVFRSAFSFFDTRLEGNLIQITYDATNLGDDLVEENATLSLEGPAFEGREDVAFSQGEDLYSDETKSYYLITGPIDDPGIYTAYVEDKEIGTIEVLPASNPIYLANVNRLQDSIISGIEAPMDPSAAGEASVDVRYENLGETSDSVESELVASDGDTEIASVTETISVAGESTTTARLSVPLAEEGVYDLAVDGQSVGEVEVLVDGVQDGDSIQTAIDAAQPGDTIIVGDGTYEESLTIDKPLTLRSLSDDGAVLEGGDDLERAMTVTADDVTVEGFRIQGYTADGDDAAIYIDSGEKFTFSNNTLTGSNDGIQTESSMQDIVIADNRIYENDGDAIRFVEHTDRAEILRNTITGSNMAISVNGAETLSVVENDVTDASNGIHMSDINDVVIEDNVVVGVRFTGVRFSGSIGDIEFINNTVTDGTNNAVLQPGGGTNSINGDVTFVQNTIDNNGGDGVSLRLRGVNASVTDNNVSNNDGLGIDIDINGETATISNNVVTNNRGEIGFSIELDTTNSTIESNTVRNNNDGLVVNGASPDDVNITVVENTIEDNAGMGLTIGEYYESFLVTENAIAGNNDGLFYNPGDEYLLDARNNWWGDASGPSGGVIDNQTSVVADGSGDSITIREVWWLDEDSVQFDPWLETALDDTGTLEGTVTDEATDEPIDGATLEVTDGSTVVDTAETAGGGSYAFTLPAGTYDLTVGADGYEEFETDITVITDETVTRDVGLTEVESSTGTVTGTVTRESTSESVEGALVSARDSEGTVATVAADTEGSYELGLEPGTYTLEATEEGGPGLPESGTVENVEVTEGETTTVDLVLIAPEPEPKLESIELSISETTLTEGGSLIPAIVTATFDNGTTEDVSNEATLESDNTAVVEIVDLLSLPNPAVSPEAPGTATVTATYGGETDSVEVTVEADEEPEPEVESIELSISETTLTEDRSLVPVVVTATFDNGTTEDVSNEANLESDNTTVVEIINLISLPTPAISPEAPGTATVTATYGGETDSVEVTVEADEEPQPDPEPELEVLEASVTPTQLETGEEATIEATIENGGEGDGELIVPLEVNGGAVETKTVTLNAGESADVTFTRTFESAGEFQISVGGVDAGTVTVIEDVDADILIYGADVNQSSIALGETIRITGDLLNNGGVGTFTADLNVDDERIDTTTVEVSPGATPGAVDFEWTPTESDLPAGEDEMNATITLNGFVVETVHIEKQYSDISVVAASTSEMELIEGEETYVIGTIHQGGNIEGTEEIELTATHNETGETHVVGSQEATLSPGYYLLGGINITFQPEEAGTYDLELGDWNAGTVEVEPAESDIQVIAASTSEIELIEGEETYVIGSVYQAGNVEGTEEIELTATHNETGETHIFGSQEVTLSPGYYLLGGINITFEPEEAGTYDLELGDRNAGTVEVEAAESDIQVIAASVADVELLQTEETYVIGSIYQAGNTDGTEEIALNATHQETGETHTVDTVEAELSPGYYLLGGINITFEPEEAGTYDLELGDRNAGFVEVEPAEPDIQVIAASASEVEVIEGEEVSVIGSIHNSGDVEGTETIELTATNNQTDETHVLGSQEVTLSPGYYLLGGINITFEPDEPGYYDLELGDRDAGLIAVEEAITDITVVAASTSEMELIEGEETYVIGSVYQGGNVEETEEIDLTATHNETGETEVIGSQEVTLSPGYYLLGGINITFEPEEAGTYDLELGDRNAGTVEVEPAESDIQVIAASVSQLELIEGEEAHVIGSVYQGGNIEGTEEIDLTATHQETGETHVVGTQEVTLSPGYYLLGGINITFEPDETGHYDLELGDRNAGTVEVEPAESDIQVIAASVSQLELIEGEETYVIGSVYQGGNVEETEEISLTATHQETGETEVIGSQEVTLSPGYYLLGGINITFEPDETGHYDLELGDMNAGWVEVDESTVEASIIDVDGHSVNFDPDTETEQTYASEDVTVTIEIDADLDLETVNVLVSSLETSYVRSFEASHDAGETWTATVSPEDIADDGRYEVSVVAVDQVGTVGTDTEDRTLVIDRDAPRLSSTLVNVDGDSATVVVESDKPLVDAPEVAGVFTDPDGSTESDSVSMHSVSGSNTHFTGTFATGETGTYEITSTGTDRAGNEGTDTASVTVDTRFTLGDGVIEIGDTGTAIEFEVADEADQAILTQELFASLSETTANANLDSSQLGVGFITAELDNLLDDYLEQGTVESAEISMAIDEGELPGSVSADEVELHYYDDADGVWDPVAGSSVEIDPNGDPFLTASVSGFSTYGAFVPDTEPPVVDAQSPIDGETVDATDGEVTIRFTYADDRSGIDVGSVSLEVDGEDITDRDVTTVTSSETEHSLTVDPGTSYVAALTVSDNAGNPTTETVAFSVDEETTSSSSGSSSSTGSSSETEDETDTEDTETDAPEEEPQPEPELESELEPESESELEPEPESELEPESDSEFEPDSGVESESESEPELEPEPEDQAGFGAIVALIALLSAALLARRRS